MANGDALVAQLLTDGTFPSSYLFTLRTIYYTVVRNPREEKNVEGSQLDKNASFFLALVPRLQSGTRTLTCNRKKKKSREALCSADSR